MGAKTVSGISHKYPTYRRSNFITIESWLAGKRADDGAEGLWRIRDTLYDFSVFQRQHPGGSFWLQQTRGTDITEAFESHHPASLKPGKLLAQYEVRTASQPRNYKFSLDERGFYMTLKTRVRQKLAELEHFNSSKTDLLHTVILCGLLFFAALTALTNWLIWRLLAGLALCWLANASHNYFHRRDNWRMYAFNLTLLNFNVFRISHALSHHGYTNSLFDLECSFFEPFLCWMPDAAYAPKWQRIVSILISPVVFALLFFDQILKRSAYSLMHKNVLYWHDLLPYTLPVFMFLTTGGTAPFLSVLAQWLSIIAFGGFFFGFVGVTAAHHDPRIYHDGDAPRSDRDWGLYQLDTIIDRSDIKCSDLLVLTHYGEHALHHLFPTLDHGILKHLYPELRQTLREFNVELREMNHWRHIIGHHKQLLRTEPNKNVPGGG